MACISACQVGSLCPHHLVIAFGDDFAIFDDDRAEYTAAFFHDGSAAAQLYRFVHKFGFKFFLEILFDFFFFENVDHMTSIILLPDPYPQQGVKSNKMYPSNFIKALFYFMNILPLFLLISAIPVKNA